MDIDRLKLAGFLAAGLCLGLAAGCDRDPPYDSVRLKVGEAPDYMHPTEKHDTGPIALSAGAEATIAELRAIIDRNSLSQFARYADQQPGFISNFAGASHRDHWDLLRRTGFDPLARLEELLDGPYGVKSVAGDTWYIWPELAALEPDQLRPERLNFRQRARLEELVGEAGIERVRQGSGYPGIRTAISTEGRWLYYVHETPGEE
ncbi:hypothetical protein [Henriciella litoralis]|uniref:hypothetical protein n=1 Tax=Henriciella litoralis TaxID=568102 RepID=UPI0009FD1906|nr:hypothetical protein [Henriciella litoralis]